MPVTSVNMKRNQETWRYKANGNIWRRTQRYKQRRKWTKSYIINHKCLGRSVAQNLLNRRSVCMKTSGKYFPIQTSHLVNKPLNLQWYVIYKMLKYHADIYNKTIKGLKWLAVSVGFNSVISLPWAWNISCHNYFIIFLLDLTGHVCIYGARSYMSIVLPEIGAWVAVRVSAIYDPTHFWVQLPFGREPIDSQIIKSK